MDESTRTKDFNIIDVEFEDIPTEHASYLVHDLKNEIRHGMCVSLLAGKVAREMKFDHNFCHDVEIAGMLHDIGKLKISNYIYGRNKDAMNIEEMGYIRQHAKLGHDIIIEQGYPEHIAEMVLYHHENYDGSGYPFNLMKEDIPMGARILRVCDVFAALSSDRPYRKAFPYEKATEMMIDEVKEFDMRVFLAFQNVIHTTDIVEQINKVQESK